LNLFEFGFEFNRFPPVTGQTGPVNRNRSPAVTGNRLGNKTLATGQAHFVSSWGEGGTSVPRTAAAAAAD